MFRAVTVGVLYTAVGAVKVPPGTVGEIELRSSDGHSDYVLLRVPQGLIKCAPSRIRSV